MADKLGEQIDTILEKYFKDPIDTPCPYCEARKEILAKLKSLGYEHPDQDCPLKESKGE